MQSADHIKPFGPGIRRRTRRAVGRLTGTRGFRLRLQSVLHAQAAFASLFAPLGVGLIVNPQRDHRASSPLFDRSMDRAGNSRTSSRDDALVDRLRSNQRGRQTSQRGHRTPNGRGSSDYLVVRRLAAEAEPDRRSLLRLRKTERFEHMARF